MLSAVILVIGVAAFIGNALIGRVVQRSLTGALVAAPAAMAAIAALLALFGASVAVVTCLLALWGLFSSAAVAWWTWVTRAVPDDAEGGGLMVAVIQLAITLGATIGGIVFDRRGVVPEFLAGAVILAMAMVLAIVAGAILTRHLRHLIVRGVDSGAGSQRV